MTQIINILKIRILHKYSLKWDAPKSWEPELERFINIQKIIRGSNEITENLNLTRRTILRDIEELKNENKIKRIGRRKSGYWEVV